MRSCELYETHLVNNRGVYCKLGYSRDHMMWGEKCHNVYELVLRTT